MSTTAGDGSIKLDARYDGFLTSKMAVTPGQMYTASVMIRTSTWPSGVVTVLPQEMSAAGDWVRNYPDQEYLAPGSPNTWQEANITFRATSPYVSMMFTRNETQFSNGDMWIDEVNLVPGVKAVQPNTTAKRAFTGANVRVDTEGNWYYKNGAVWANWFPLCAAVDVNRPSYVPIRNAGFDCDIWGGGYDFNAGKDQAAGLRSFMQLAQYYLPGGWAYRNWSDLSQRIKAIYTGPYAGNFAGYWFDNEPNPTWAPWSDYETMAATVDAADRSGGARRAPMIQLQNGSYARAFATAGGSDFADVISSYIGIGNLLLRRTTGDYRVPVSHCQINDVYASMRSTVYNCIASGGRSISVWGDNSEVGAMDTKPWWPEFPAISREVNQLLPVIVAPESSGMTSTQGNGAYPIAWVAKNVGGVHHVIMANHTQSSQNLVLSPGFAVAEVRDYFTNALISSPNGATQITISVSGISVSGGSRVVKLIPR